MLGESYIKVSEKIGQLKMRSPLDGKKYLTDAADVETMLRIVQSVPSLKAKPIKQWLAQEGARRLDEVAAQCPKTCPRQSNPFSTSNAPSNNASRTNDNQSSSYLTPLANEQARW